MLTDSYIFLCHRKQAENVLIIGNEAPHTATGVRSHLTVTEETHLPSVNAHPAAWHIPPLSHCLQPVFGSHLLLQCIFKLKDCCCVEIKQKLYMINMYSIIIFFPSVSLSTKLSLNIWTFIHSCTCSNLVYIIITLIWCFNWS